MSAPPEVSVVVATHNRAERLEALLAGLRAQTLPADRFEVIVVDDGSGDSTADVLRREHDRRALRLTTLRNRRPLGPSTARNRGWPVAQAPVVAFTDDDCVPTPGWLRALLAHFGNGDEPVVTGVTAPDPAEAHLLDLYSKTVDISRRSPHYETCNIAYPRALLERVGGFDESYPTPAGEDSDLGCRAVAAGGAPVFEPDAVVHHAVFARGPLGAFKDALLATDGVRPYKHNPGLREHLPGRVFYGRSHPLLAAAVAGAILARRSPAALAMCLPYAHNLRSRTAARGGSARDVPFLVAFDALQTLAVLRGAVRHRTFML
jgi:glycosyltransferase involved in cell wall biosynthesis